MTTLINKNVIDHPNPRSSNVILLETVGTVLETSYPNGVYAQLTYPVTDVSSSPSLSSGSVLENTAYQDTPFSAQLSSVSNGSADQITSNAKKGWMTLSVDTDGTDVVYVGAVGVTVNNGYKLSASNPTITISSDDLSEWYVTGAAGGESLFIIGAYIG